MIINKTLRCSLFVWPQILSPLAVAQTTVNINDGQVLTESDLNSGLFDGTTFTLGQDTTFEIDSGGLIGASVLHGPAISLDFVESTVNVNGGGMLGNLFNRTYVSDVALNVLEDGSVGSLLEISDSIMNVTGGDVGSNFTAGSGTTVNVFDGTFGSEFNADPGSIVNISGGDLGNFRANGTSIIDLSGGSVDDFVANSGSTLDVSGGSIRNLNVNSGSVVDITGGSVNARFLANSGSTASISGGGIGGQFQARAGSNVSLFGGEFHLNGLPYSGSTISLTGSDLFTGTLEDGSTFIVTPNHWRLGRDEVVGVTLNTTSLPALDTTPIVIDGTNGPGPRGLRVGQSLTVETGGTLSPGFAMIHSTLMVNGGTVGGLEMVESEVILDSGRIGGGAKAFTGSTLNVVGGSLGGFFTAYNGSVVNISGGTIDEMFQANNGSTINISGGNFDKFVAGNGSVVNISGGTLPDLFNAFSGSTINISGGSFGNRFNANDGSILNLFVRDLTLDGLPQELTVGIPFEVDTSFFPLLDATLADSSNFRLDGIDRDASIIVHLIPEPTAGLLSLIGGILASIRVRR